MLRTRQTLGELAPSVVPQRLVEDGEERDCSSPGLRLWRFGRAVIVELSADTDFLRLEIDVRPLKSKSLRDSQAGPGERRDHGAVARRCSFAKATDLALGQAPRFPPAHLLGCFDSRQAAQRIGCEVPAGECEAEDGPR